MLLNVISITFFTTEYNLIGKDKLSSVKCEGFETIKLICTLHVLKNGFVFARLWAWILLCLCSFNSLLLLLNLLTRKNEEKNIKKERFF